ncbi:hypothetical protein AcV5_002607 [Taiwanofungus camphoratus]|nr:hypothetical protein AcV5_002607 [Antrodia cinnamomea]
MSSFASSLTLSSSQPEDAALASYVFHIWFGPTSVTTQHDLSYMSPEWPPTFMRQILSTCTSLRALAVVNFPQHLFGHIENTIPASVESLYLGPDHGLLGDLSQLRCYTTLRNLASVNTVLSDWEIEQVVSSPCIRRFRRFYSSSYRMLLAFGQLRLLSEATSLEQMQIIFCDETTDSATLVLNRLSNEHKDMCQDKRVVLTPKSYQPYGGVEDEIRLMYDDWEAGFGLF